MPHRPKRRRDPFEVKIDDERKRQLVEDLVGSLEDAKDARGWLDEEAKYWMQLYEQGRTRIGKNTPWPDAADLTSYLATEKVDAIVARMSKTIFTEPIWTVEGWGESQSRAPQVEEFHQWKAEEERLQSAVERAVLLSFIDPIGVLEVSEDTERRMVQEKKTVKLALDPITGAPILDEDNQPIPQRDDQGRLVEADPADPEGTIELMVDEAQRIRSGPTYRVIPFRDFYMLPGHARDRKEVWGYAKRVFRRLPEIRKKADQGWYDKTVVDAMGDQGERTNDLNEMDERSRIAVVERSGDSAEKELWEFLVLQDLDGEGERWYLVTLHGTDVLRVQKDDLAALRYIIFTPIPRPDSVYGYSMVGDKLITIVEEHTAWRNMLADKGAMTLMSPIKRLITSSWDPDEQPLGPKSVIDVRDMREVEPMQIPDISRGPVEREREVVAAGERLAGINDISLGTQPRADRTLGEVQLVSQQSAVRMEQMIRHIQESMEDLFQIRHRIWVRTLAERDARRDPMQLPASVLTGLENRGVRIPEDGTITADVLDGAFRGKPRGSVETADLVNMRQDFIQFVQMLPGLLALWPQMQQMLQTPEATRAMLSEAVRLFRFENRQAFLAGASPEAQLMQQLQALLGQGQQGQLPAGPQGQQGQGQQASPSPNPRLPQQPLTQRTPG